MKFSRSAESYQALIVDDEPALRQAMARAFQRCGIRCDLAGNGRQALQLLNGQSYDVVVTDLNMPEMNGHRLVVELLEQPHCPVVMVVTGVTEPKIECDLRARGVDEILFKPVDYASLAARAEALLQRRAAQTLPQSCTLTDSLPGAASGAETDGTLPAAAGETLDGSSTSKAMGLAPSPANSARSTINSGSDSSLTVKPPIAVDTPAFQANDRIERLERELMAISGQRHFTWLWPVVAFQAGILVGWLLASWSR